MTRDDEINQRYFGWMYDLVCAGKRFRRSSFKKVLTYLHQVDFCYTIAMDENRESDGIDLRYRFGYENDISDHEIASVLDNRPCSVLEMMVALSLRCEENIMDDPDIGNRTGLWFWEMMKSLGLYSMSDSRFSKKQADIIVQRFLNREYGRDGQGGLFTISAPPRDMRSVEIWYQMMWHLDETAEN